MRGPLPLVVARRLTALVATVIIAPTLAYVVFGALAGTLGQSAPAAAGDYAVKTFWHGDFGFSQRFNGSMRDVLAWTLPVDVTMVVGILVLGMALGVAGGLIASSRPGTFHSRGLQGLAALLLCCPPYLLPLMMLVLFAPGIGRIAEIPFLSVPNLYRDEPYGFFGWRHLLWLRLEPAGPLPRPSSSSRTCWPTPSRRGSIPGCADAPRHPSGARVRLFLYGEDG